ncbi:MFS transporter [Streptomyces sp. Da 82-17]|uniref:MFS transporter n=1 Tax=Streptomyces sp. Da 82-17 TaxID=3377116 RepID=UPI0038D47E8B
MTTSEPATARTSSPSDGADPARPTRIQKRVLAGGSVGQFIEFYDFTLYALSAVTLASLFFPGQSQLASLLSTFATFGVAFLVRPLGGLFFGALGDRIGRRRVLYITLLSIGTATALIGLLPTYATIGAAAPALLVLCRLVQGFSAGGESVGAPAFVFEHAPLHRRGFWLNITLAATALPSVVGGTLFLVLSRTLGQDAFQSYGWRIPFLLSLPLAFFGLWIRSRTEESPAFRQVLEQAERQEHSPVKDAFRENKARMLQVVLVMGLTAMGFYFVSGYFVSYIETAGGLSREQSLLTNAAAMLLYAVLLPVWGIVGDRVGRRPMLIAGSVALAVVAVPSFALVTGGSLGLALLGQALFVVCLTLYGGGCYTFFVEIFTTRTRFTSAAVSYNVAYALFGGTAPFVGTWLTGLTGVPASPGYYMAAAAAIVLVLLLATRVPETHPQRAAVAD